MKKFLSIMLVSAMVLSFTACDSSKNVSDISDISEDNSENTQSKPRFRTEEYLDGCEPDDFNATNHENPREDYSTEEVVKIIEENSDFKISEELSAHVPKSLGHVSTLYMGRPLYPSGEKVIEDFNALFKYLYPDDEVDESILEFTGPNLNTGEFVRGVMSENNYHNDVLNGVIQPTEFIYLDKYTDDNTPQHQLVIQPPTGMSITTINKGVFGTVAREMNILDGGHGENYTPELYFPIVGVYEPDSGNSFPLLDGEMKICDAVNFFENYIQNMPASSQTYYGVHVNSVYVYQIRDDLYYYFFAASKIYDNIPFDYMMNGNHSHDSNRDMNAGGMIECGDVDFIYCTDKTETVIGEEQFNEVLPFSEAVRIASEKMTDYVDFEITRAELVYKQKSAIGSLNWGETKIPVYPAWKVELYNPNDDITYDCFVNAVDGTFEYSN